MRKNHPLYRTWEKMRERCNNPNSISYARYGGKGVKVCARWDEFLHFIEDMGERPDGHTLDRINGDEDYCPENCRWATHKEQAANRKQAVTARLITAYGKTMTLSEWSRHTGVPISTIFNRLNRGWPDERAVSC